MFSFIIFIVIIIIIGALYFYIKLNNSTNNSRQAVTVMPSQPITDFDRHSDSELVTDPLQQVEIIDDDKSDPNEETPEISKVTSLPAIDLPLFNEKKSIKSSIIEKPIIPGTYSTTVYETDLSASSILEQYLEWMKSDGWEVSQDSSPSATSVSGKKNNETLFVVALSVKGQTKVSVNYTKK